MRSRAVRRDLACWLSMAFGPPPSRSFSSSLRTWATRSASARMLDSKRRELGSTLVARTLLTERAVESVRSRMRADFETTCETTYYTSGAKGEARRSRRRFGMPGAGKRPTLQSKNVAEARIPARLADRDGGNCGVALNLYGYRGWRSVVPTSGRALDAKQCV